MRDYQINETAHDLVLYSILFILSFLPSPFLCPLLFLPSFFFSLSLSFCSLHYYCSNMYYYYS